MRCFVSCWGVFLMCGSTGSYRAFFYGAFGPNVGALAFKRWSL